MIPSQHILNLSKFSPKCGKFEYKSRIREIQIPGEEQPWDLKIRRVLEFWLKKELIQVLPSSRLTKSVPSFGLVVFGVAISQETCARTLVSSSDTKTHPQSNPNVIFRSLNWSKFLLSTRYKKSFVIFVSGELLKLQITYKWLQDGFLDKSLFIIWQRRFFHILINFFMEIKIYENNINKNITSTIWNAVPHSLCVGWCVFYFFINFGVIFWKFKFDQISKTYQSKRF